MTLGCLRLVLCHAARGACHSVRSTSPVTLLLPHKIQPYKPLSAYLGMTIQQWTPFSTAVGGSEETEESEPQKRKKKQDPKARVTIGSVGRKIHQRHLQLLGEDGADLGVMHRVDALRLMDEKGLKMVPINEYSDPPVYRLMSGKQIHEEQMKLREKQKAKAAGSVQVKELTMSSDIAPHDLDTKLRQVAHWLDKKHHIRLTLKAGGGSGSDTALDTLLDQMVEKMSVPVGFVSKTRIIREGRAAMCILRPPSAKELQQRGAQTSKPESGTQKPASTSQPDQSEDSQQP
ncbi:translation initiation factor IF-3, mitochondrial [Colossoma macropomum]|uniref:translation initiation factor IF-3, mitochondrial n=1 Tax=Colossoma macropomum TaxID=42526 RepID=UPI0018648CDE|nr:translation initiation factor IF-3, mitochondrial [Colossoma macropomum]